MATFDSGYVREDLNDWINPDSGYVLAYTNDIKDSEQIVGAALVTVDGVVKGRAYRLTPALAPAKARNWNDSWNTAMNNTGLVVGQSLNGENSVMKVKHLTFLYSDAFGMVDLLKFVDGMPADSHPEALGAPRAINDNGWICGTSQWGPYVLIPKPAN